MGVKQTTGCQHPRDPMLSNWHPLPDIQSPMHHHQVLLFSVVAVTCYLINYLNLLSASKIVIKERDPVTMYSAPYSQSNLGNALFYDELVRRLMRLLLVWQIKKVDAPFEINYPDMDTLKVNIGRSPRSSGSISTASFVLVSTLITDLGVSPGFSKYHHGHHCFSLSVFILTSFCISLPPCLMGVYADEPLRTLAHPYIP